MLVSSKIKMQIKGDKQLFDITSLVEFLTSKFNELKKERKQKDELINSLEIKFHKQIFKCFLKVKVKNIQKKANDHEEYSRRSC